MFLIHTVHIVYVSLTDEQCKCAGKVAQEGYADVC
jgi:hypothetical protein